MRKKLIAFSLILFFINVKAQITYHNYLDSTCEWRYYNCCPDWGGGRTYTTQYFDGDTSINGSFYYRKKTCWKYEGQATPIFLRDCFVREDSNRNFICYFYNYGVFTLDTIYKFHFIVNLNNNDSFPNSNFYNPVFGIPNSYYSKCVVHHKDSFYLGSRKLKAISSFSPPYINFRTYPGIIEGIGAAFPSTCSNGIFDLDHLCHYNKNSNHLAFYSINYPLEPFDTFPKPIRTHSYTVLPLKLLSFTTTLQQNKVLLNWHTANEVNVSHFNIQRSSNGKDFITIGKVNAACCNYNFIDPITNTQYPTTFYYRLEIVDKDGSKTYSTIQQIKIKPQTPNSVSIYPNPTNSIVTIECVGAMQLLIIDNLGRSIQQYNNITQPQTVNTKQLTKGVYIVKVVMNNGEVKTEKLIIN
ncbi:MAG: T9SS type A sorting domain-containing protein [Chitinophagaceae bacterium]